MSCSRCKKDRHNARTCAARNESQGSQTNAENISQGRGGSRGRGINGRGLGRGLATSGGVGRGRGVSTKRGVGRGRGAARGTHRFAGIGVYTSTDTGKTVINPGTRTATVIRQGSTN
ncbi:hypothetical protein LINGRAHAP2_LOCUS3859 [Linum grandiflorum]